ncbi:Uncharacterized conserved protein YgbK, DUF1537 family [Thermanaeromonas toyohensis ToBE]|uniref:Uncharacterized conserved protein YgbK, DUF1537 family n=1 Tax=Thermanaeromonas toyohensis ToBE TaxID=698762 RepID=A0A1W1W026_9FIRM|nr:four-carbon acid sugar kinase family protein [Thermanaeromonas toyohensis]SMB98948.1 Uncharacterized conserved protein YgbK, DUF1537 family [Thermanaeromonas toyohensis ToBE]
MSLLAVIADDLTGAGDTGIQFANTGFKTRVFLQWTDVEPTNDVEVIVLNTDSRAVNETEAYTRVQKASRRLKELGVTGIYKKIDSTLRGNIGQEIDALLNEFDFDLALISPSFPANGRTVVGGYLLVNGELVSRTALAHDPVFPVRESYIPALLSNQSRYQVGHLPLSLVSQGSEAIASFLREAREKKIKIVVADAISDQDLTSLVVGASLSGVNLFYVGSAGLALPVARSWATSYRQRSKQLMLLVCGSVNPRSREQIDVVAQKAGWKIITINPISYLRDESSWQDSLKRELDSILNSFNLEGLILTTPGTPDEVAKVKEAAIQLGLSLPDLPGKVVLALAQATLLTLELVPVKGFILTGGDTATAVMKAFGSKSLDLFAEVSPGVPIGRFVGGKYNHYPVVTKAGGFGGKEVLWEAVGKLRNL